MKRRLWVAVIAFDVLALLAILLIGVYCVWTPGPASGVDNTQARLCATWALLGLVPAIVSTVALWLITSTGWSPWRR